jgi:hypothetical protein
VLVVRTHFSLRRLGFVVLDDEVRRADRRRSTQTALLLGGLFYFPYNPLSFWEREGVRVNQEEQL